MLLTVTSVRLYANDPKTLVVYRDSWHPGLIMTNRKQTIEQNSSHYPVRSEKEMRITIC